MYEGQGVEPVEIAIEASNLHKTYGSVEALRGVGFKVPVGCIYSILGPNGAGKTTLLKILTTISRPDEGSVKILGLDIRQNPVLVRHNIGVVSQENHFETYFTIWENLALHARMHGMPAEDYRPRIEKLLRGVDLWERRDARSDELSGGMQRRVSLVRALIHEPQVLFLDEPTTGLDPLARRQIWEAIREFKSNDATVVLTTHYMEEADLLSDRILMINEGQVVMAGTSRELKQAITPINRYELIFRTPKAAWYEEKLRPMVPFLRRHDEYALEMNLAAPDEIVRVLDVVDAADVLRIGVMEPDLEEVFLSVARSESRSDQGATGRDMRS